MSVPAWKRLGLKVKALVSNDPLAITPERLDPDAKAEKKSKKSKKSKKEKTSNAEKEADINTKEVVNEKKRKLEESVDNDIEHKAKKPPKKAKVPKSERKVSNVVKDQLVYMRQFSNDRTNWKFSKQKQNWILKNIREIPEEYENDLIVYLQSVQGGSRDRIVNEMKEVVEEWNKIVEAAEEQIKKDLEEAEKKVDEDEKIDDDSKIKNDVEPALTKKEKKKLKQEKQKVEAKKTVVDYDYAVRASTIYEALTKEKLKLSGMEEEKEEEKVKEPETVVEVIEESVYL